MIEARTRIVHTKHGPALLIEDVINHIHKAAPDLEDRGGPYFYENGRRSAIRDLISKFKYIQEKVEQSRASKQ